MSYRHIFKSQPENPRILVSLILLGLATSGCGQREDHKMPLVTRSTEIATPTTRTSEETSQSFVPGPLDNSVRPKHSDDRRPKIEIIEDESTVSEPVSVAESTHSSFFMINSNRSSTQNEPKQDLPISPASILGIVSSPDGARESNRPPQATRNAFEMHSRQAFAQEAPEISSAHKLRENLEENYKTAKDHSLRREEVWPKYLKRLSDYIFKPTPQKNLRVKNFFSNQVYKLWKANKGQEAIWLAQSEAEQNPMKRPALQKMKNKLKNWLFSDAFEIQSSVLPGVTRAHVIRLKNFNIFGIFKSDGGTHYLVENPDLPPDEGFRRSVANALSEVAAYELDQLLELNIVPITAFRELNGEWGSIQYFLRGDHFKNLHQGKYPRRSESFTSLMVLDFLAGNPDRHRNNWLNLETIKRNEFDQVVAIDHGLAFRGRDGGCMIGNQLVLFFGIGERCWSHEEILHESVRRTISVGQMESELVKEFKKRAATEFSPRYLNANVRERINTVTDKEVSEALSQWVEEDEIYRLIERLHQLRAYLASPRLVMGGKP